MTAWTEQTNKGSPDRQGILDIPAAILARSGDQRLGIIMASSLTLMHRDYQGRAVVQVAPPFAVSLTSRPSTVSCPARMSFYELVCACMSFYHGRVSSDRRVQEHSLCVIMMNEHRTERPRLWGATVHTSPESCSQHGGGALLPRLARFKRTVKS